MDPRTLERVIRRLRARDPVGADSCEEAIQRLIRNGRARFQAPQRDTESDGPARQIARLIDHTALKPETSAADVETLCEEAMRYGFATVCINPCYVRMASALLSDSAVGVCSVVGFPIGANRTQTKVREAEAAVSDGAGEVDMVLNVGMLKSRALDYVEADIRSVVEALNGTAVTKVILETALLTNAEKVEACILAEAAGADFVKTSTGFSSGGATREDVELMRHVVDGRIGVKASGGIRTAKVAIEMIEAGATRIGASASVAIVRGSPDGVSRPGGSSEY